MQITATATYTGRRFSTERPRPNVPGQEYTGRHRATESPVSPEILVPASADIPATVPGGLSLTGELIGA